MVERDEMDMPSDEAMTSAIGENINRLHAMLRSIEETAQRWKDAGNNERALSDLRELRARSRRELKKAILVREALFEREALRRKNALTNEPIIEKAGRSYVNSSTRPEVPRGAEFILDLLLSPKEQDAVIGDLEENYAKRVKKFGMRRAKIWIYMQVLRSAAPLLWRLASLGWLLEWVRRHVS